MKTLLLGCALAATLGLSGAYAQTTPPVGGPDAKGNAPLKHAHSVNDGSARPGANSFTEGQARRHIMHSGFTDVTGLAKGQDGVWRGQAMRDGQPVSVAMDYKGNVTTSPMGGGDAASSGAMTTGAPPSGGAMTDGAAASSTAAAASSTTTTTHHHRHHHHAHSRCADPGPNGVACSGVSTMENGVSDKEAHALQSGAHP